MFVVALIGATMFLEARADAVPANPDVVKLTQPDGTTFRARMWGDEYTHGWETSGGYTIVKGPNRYWRYARRASNGKLQARRERADARRPHGARRHVRPARFGEEKGRFAAMERSAALGPPGGTHFDDEPVLVILADFNDRVGVTPASYFSDLFFGAGDSVRSYYDAASDGNLTLDPATESFGTANDGVVGWVRINRDHPRSSAGDLGGNITLDAITAADQAGMDFAPFDHDNNGKIEGSELHIIVVAAGFDQAYYSECAPAVWPHHGGTNGRTADGKNVGSEYVLLGERQCYRWYEPGIFEHPVTVGTPVHEMGHVLGLPDLYDTDDSDGTSAGVGNWSVMGHGSYNRSSPSAAASTKPAMLDAFSRYYEGWITPPEARGTANDLNVRPASESSDAVRILDNPGGVDWSFNQQSGEGEYFLAEYRKQTGWDAGIPACGLLVWHIDETRTSSNKANADEGRKLVDLEEADGRDDLDANSNQGDGGDPFGGSSGKYDFTATSYPGTSLYSGVHSGSSLHVDSTSCGGTMQFDVNTFCTDDIFEPSEPTQFRRNIGSGSVIRAKHCPNDPDYYGIGARTGNQITLTMTSDSGRGNLDLRLETIGGNLLASSVTNGDVETLTYTVTGPTTTYVPVVYGRTASDESSYTLSATVGGCNDDSWEPNDSHDLPTSKNLAANQDVHAQICAADPDYYRFYMADLYRTVMTVTYPSDAAELDLRLEDDTGKVVAEATGATPGSKTLKYRNASYGHFFYPVVTSPRGLDNGYTLSVRTELCYYTQEEAGEVYNGYRENATPIAAGATKTGYICNNQFYWDDYFSFDAWVGRTVTGTLDTLSEYGDEDATLSDLTLTLKDANGTTLATSDAPGHFHQINYTITKQGKYYWLVRPKGNYDEAGYQLKHEITACADDAMEDNDTPVFATPLTSGVTVSGRACDPDVFRVSLAEGQRLDGTLNFTNANGDLQLELRGPTYITTLASSTGVTDKESVSYTAPSSGFYYLRAYGLNGNENDYSLKALVSPTSTVSFAQVGPVAGNPIVSVTEGSPVQLQIVVDPPNVAPVSVQVDTSNLSATAGSDYTAKSERVTVPAGGTGTLALSIPTTQDATDEPDEAFKVTLSSPSPNATLGTRKVASGEIRDDDPTPCSDDGFEPNDFRDSATMMLGGGAFSGSVAGVRVCPGDPDYFRTDNTPFQQLTVDLSFNNAQGDIDLELQNAAGDVLATSAGTGNTEQIVYTSQFAERYFAVVRGDAGVENAYSLSMTKTTGCGDDSKEQNDSLAASAPIAVDTTFDGQVCPGDPDYFSVPMKAGEKLVATMERFKADGPLDIRLFLDDGTKVCDSNGQGGDVWTCRSDLVPSDQDLHVEIFGAASVANDYKLIVSREAGSKIRVDSFAFSAEGETTSISPITIFTPNPGPIEFDVVTRDDTATGDVDYTPLNSQHVVIPPMATEGFFDITALSDAIDENPEDFSVHLINLSSNAFFEFDDNEFEYTIFDTNSPPTVNIKKLNNAVEGGRGLYSHLDFEISLSNPSGIGIEVEFFTTDGTARSTKKGRDYYGVVRTVGFQPGQTVKTVRVLVRGDRRREKDETITGGLRFPGSVVIGVQRAVGKILNDD